MNKTKNRPRLSEIVQKIVNLRKSYRTNLNKLESTLSIDDWNKKYLKYAESKIVFESCMKILEESKIIKKSNRFKLAVETVLNRNRLSKVIDIKLGTALVQIYNGNPDNLNAFLDAVDLFKSNTEAQKLVANETIFKFDKTLLTGVARQAVGRAADLDRTITHLKEQCSPKINSDNKKSKINCLETKRFPR